MTFDWWICRRGHIIPDGEVEREICPVLIPVSDVIEVSSQGRPRYTTRRCRCKLEPLTRNNYDRTWPELAPTGLVRREFQRG